MSLFKIQMLVKDDTKAICRWFGVIGEGAEALIDFLKTNVQGQTCKTSVLLHELEEIWMHPINNGRDACWGC